ncbi:MAG: PrsW family intramembrane metalloprotease [Lewinellaceae bacterium]|nr:PrsW family intramembrane metalloprotease [Saprospiraceae bacterium]MCB9340702.1 PrsW family intramembrane metalloprotease [Lewinellaceae bacterium]
MSTIKFNCPSCRQPLEAAETQAGNTVECPTCFLTVQIPTEETPEIMAPPSLSPPPEAQEPPKSKVNPNLILETGAKQAKEIFEDLKHISFQEEILPIDHNNIAALMKDFVFWAVTLLGIIPLLIVTVQDPNTQLTLFALFFAFVWGVILKKFVLNDAGAWRLGIASFFFTGIAGVWLLLFIYRTFLPNFYLNLPDSKNALVSLFGFIFQVGLWEEMLKALPLLIVLRLLKLKVKPIHLVTIGVFSGLGFAAFENLHYGENAVFSTYSLTRDYGVQGLVTGVQNAMVITMLRAVSLVFCHAVWSGIVSYFVATAMIRRERVAALIITGIAVAASVHGVYDWLAGIQPTIAALLAGFSFALFYGYLLKLRSMEGLYESQQG